MLTQNEIRGAAKSLRWLANQVPDDLGDSNEDRMLKCIKLYSTNAADILEKCAEKETPHSTDGMLNTMCNVCFQGNAAHHNYCSNCGQKLR